MPQLRTGLPSGLEGDDRAWEKATAALMVAGLDLKIRYVSPQVLESTGRLRGWLRVAIMRTEIIRQYESSLFEQLIWSE